MKRLKLCLIALIICFGLYGCKGIDFTSTRRYADCMNLNWHLSLPETDWEAGELDSELAIKMNEWLDDIEVPSEERPKQNEWKHTTLLRKEDNRDRLIMFFDESTNQLYVVEYFL